jgi:hypothetical protein
MAALYIRHSAPRRRRRLARWLAPEVRVAVDGKGKDGQRARPALERRVGRAHRPAGRPHHGGRRSLPLGIHHHGVGREEGLSMSHGHGLLHALVEGVLRLGVAAATTAVTLMTSTAAADPVQLVRRQDLATAAPLSG